MPQEAPRRYLPEFPTTEDPRPYWQAEQEALAEFQAAGYAGIEALYDAANRQYVFVARGYVGNPEEKQDDPA